MYKLEKIKTAVSDIARTLPVKKVVIVGSYAKNTATDDSDIDLVMDGDNMSEIFWDFLFSLEDTFCTKIDLMTFRGLKNSCMRDDILRDGVTLYEA